MKLDKEWLPLIRFSSDCERSSNHRGTYHPAANHDEPPHQDTLLSVPTRKTRFFTQHSFEDGLNVKAEMPVQKFWHILTEKVKMTLMQYFVSDIYVPALKCSFYNFYGSKEVTLTHSLTFFNQSAELAVYHLFYPLRRLLR